MKRPYIILNNCDNTPGCPVIEACPKDIFYYDYNIKKLLLNANKCLDCGICVHECEHNAVRLIDSNLKPKKKEDEDQYGMVLADRIKEHFGIEPISIVNNNQIKEIFDYYKKDFNGNILLYVYGSWLAESYIGYSFLIDMLSELKNEIDNLEVFKIDIRNIDIELSGLPAYLTISNGKVVNKYIGIKNPMYFLSTIVEDF
jgi:NAD-dependent dihydropyrimidine dehydrogenase PreA subunit